MGREGVRDELADTEEGFRKLAKTEAWLGLAHFKAMIKQELEGDS